MTGDAEDLQQRLRLTLPTRWFGDVSPVLDSVLSGLGSIWTLLYQLLQFVIRQSRVQTATDQFLDMAAEDFLSSPLPRRQQEDDVAYRARLLSAMQRTRATRPAIVAAATAAGYTLSVFEAAQPASTGAYSVVASLAWNSVGAWGSMEMPLESLLVAQPGTDPHEEELWQNLAGAAPAGGALWLHVLQAS